MNMINAELKVIENKIRQNGKTKLNIDTYHTPSEIMKYLNTVGLYCKYNGSDDTIRHVK